MHITFSYRHSPQQIKVSLRSITYYALIICGAGFYTLGKEKKDYLRLKTTIVYCGQRK